MRAQQSHEFVSTNFTVLSLSHGSLLIVINSVCWLNCKRVENTTNSRVQVHRLPKKIDNKVSENKTFSNISVQLFNILSSEDSYLDIRNIIQKVKFS